MQSIEGRVAGAGPCGSPGAMRRAPLGGGCAQRLGRIDDAAKFARQLVPAGLLRAAELLPQQRAGGLRIAIACEGECSRDGFHECLTLALRSRSVETVRVVTSVFVCVVS